MSAKLNEVEKRKLLQEYERRRRQKDTSVKRYEPTETELQAAKTLRDTMFPKQRAFFDSTARRKVGFCSRRAGKTVGTAIHLLTTLLENPKSLCLYIAQTRDVAKVYMWKELKEMVYKYQLPFEFNENLLWMRHKRGGGTLVLRGADNEREIDKLRGPKWRVAVLDESATYGSFMEQLVVEVISPALRDENGTLILIGTAGRKREGLFYEACHGVRKRRDGTPVYELHQWSLQDNIYLSEDAKDLELICEEDGLTRDDPKFLREYMMQWVASDSERVWSGYEPGRNDFTEALLPAGHTWEFLLGLDFGWQDESAVAVIGFSKTNKTVYIMETWKKNHAFSDEIARKILEYKAKYGARRCVGDVGGQGKIFQMQLSRDYQIFVEAAKKQEKLTYIEFMNSAFLRGELKVRVNDEVCKEFLNVSWNEQRTKIGSHESDNAAHAALYGWRAANYVAGKSQSQSRYDKQLDKDIGLKQKLAVLNAKPKPEPNWWEQYADNSNRAGSPFASRNAAWDGLIKNR